MNQREFATAAGVGTSTVSRWVQGRVPPAGYIEFIAEALFLDADDVLARAGYRDAPSLATDEVRSRLISKINRVELNEERAQYLTTLLDEMGRYPLREQGTPKQSSEERHAQKDAS